VNETGEGDWSEALEVLSGAGTPEPPQAPHCVPRSAHCVLVSWNSPCNNGAKISEYRLEWLKPDAQEYVHVSNHLIALNVLFLFLWCGVHIR